MMSDVPERLTGLFRDLPEAIAFEEMKFESLSLVPRKLLSNSVKQCSGYDFIDDWRLAAVTDLFLVKFLGVVVLPEVKVLPTIHCPGGK